MLKCDFPHGSQFDVQLQQQRSSCEQTHLASSWEDESWGPRQMASGVWKQGEVDSVDLGVQLFLHFPRLKRGKICN